MTKYLKYHEAAAQLNLSRQRVFVLVDDGRLGKKQADGRYQITQRDIDKFKAIPRKPGRPSLAGPEKG